MDAEMHRQRRVVREEIRTQRIVHVLQETHNAIDRIDRGIERTNRQTDILIIFIIIILIVMAGKDILYYYYCRG